MVQHLSRRPDEHVRTSGGFALLATLFAAATLWAVYDELVVRRPWKAVQAAFNARATVLGTPPVPIAIRQVVNPDFGIVDRCTTCHVGIDRPALADPGLPQPYRAHPRLDDGFFVAHPPGTVGCTVCHGGQGIQTKGVAGAAFDHGRDDPFWEAPLLRGAIVESSCFGCHSVEQAAAHTSTFAVGRRLYADLGCQGCHESQLVPSKGPIIGPALDRVRLKFSPEALAAWIRAPQAFRPDTRMPNAWPEPTDPQGDPLPQDHPDHCAWREARQAEPRAIAAFLGSVTATDTRSWRSASAGEGDPARGARRYRNLGCPACHEDMAGRRVGPRLDEGIVAPAAWLHAWLADPRAVWSAATMPDFRLTDTERRDLVAYLVSFGTPEPSVTWPSDPALIARGEALVRELGCHGCHRIPGFGSAAQAGPTLRDYGASAPDQRDWGAVVRPPRQARLPAWTRIKIADPRRFRRPGVSLVMPRYRLTEAQTEALTVFVLADRPRRPSAFHAPTIPRDRAVARGERLIYRLGCRGCHEIGRTEVRHLDAEGALLWVDHHPVGGDIREVYGDRHLAPPSLTHAGLKLRYRWTFEYLQAPQVLRPWLPGRMPTYALSTEEAQTIVAYLAATDRQAFPFRDLSLPSLSATEREDAAWLFTEMQCLKCHNPDRTAADSPESAPDLALAHDRLTPEWVRQWLLDPQRMEPGTRMPTLFPLYDDDDPTSYTTPYPDRLGGDVDRQVAALVALTLAYGTDARLARELQARLQGEKR